eukprot:CAMPEP_0184483746 /NCGR_PEP_ID=MMETSP0113_2-20130426/5423_1 /TAXON_ID=91329 /ORGANISM="Norrisiella sphaerica, Strain BC52" /LENGTH=184 /DNA_ID=CAMNT_0026864333 /DNA_START=114 /DNA_END=668 /DNA_ORIENTATION=+
MAGSDPLFPFDQKSVEDFEDVVTRYYEKYYCIGKGLSGMKGTSVEGFDQYVQKHSNGLVVIGLAPSHPIFREKKRIERFQCEDRVATNKVHGKRKRGGQSCQPNTCIGIIHCTDRTTYPVRACVNGKLVELNDQILSSPNLLIEDARCNGFVCIIIQSKRQKATLTDTLLTKEEYTKLRSSGDK